MLTEASGTVNFTTFYNLYGNRKEGLKASQKQRDHHLHTIPASAARRGLFLRLLPFCRNPTDFSVSSVLDFNSMPFSCFSMAITSLAWVLLLRFLPFAEATTVSVPLIEMEPFGLSPSSSIFSASLSSFTSSFSGFCSLPLLLYAGSFSAAERVLQTFNGTQMPSTEQNFRLNWATYGAGERRQDDGPDFTIFVGDLAADVTDYVLQETFRAVYSSVKGAKVVTDRTTGRSKGYGFVRFGDESEQLRSMTEMNGVLCSTRPMRIGPAATKKAATGQQYQKATYQNTQGSQGENDPNNTTIFVGGLDPSVTDDILKTVFGQYGELVHVKIPAGKRCGFVQFANRTCAEQALSVLNGTQLGGQSIRLSWGRSPSNKQSDQAQWNGGGYYGFAQGYEAYGYAPPTQDPNMYYGGFPGYGTYQQPGSYQQPQQ